MTTLAREEQEFEELRDDLRTLITEGEFTYVFSCETSEQAPVPEVSIASGLLRVSVEENKVIQVHVEEGGSEACLQELEFVIPMDEEEA